MAFGSVILDLIKGWKVCIIMFSCYCAYKPLQVVCNLECFQWEL